MSSKKATESQFDKFSSNSREIFTTLKEKYPKHSNWDSYELSVLPGSIYNRKVEVFFGKAYSNPMRHPEENQYKIRKGIPLDFVLQYSLDEDSGYLTVSIHFTDKRHKQFSRKFMIINQTNKIANSLKTNDTEKHYRYLLTFISMYNKPKPTRWDKFTFWYLMNTMKYFYENKTYPPVIIQVISKIGKAVILPVLVGLFVLFIFYCNNSNIGHVQEQELPNVIPEQPDIEIINGIGTDNIESTDEADGLIGIVNDKENENE